MILHITVEAQWESAESTGLYRHSSLDVEGFIHCSTAQQIVGSANTHFKGQTGLVLLCIVPERVAAPIIYEDSYGRDQEFPHIYGTLNTDAVEQVIPFPVNDDGSFHMPAALVQELNS